MAETRFSQDVRPVTDLKKHASRLVDHVRGSRRPLLITRRGRGVAVLLDLGEYERMADRVAFQEAVEAGAQAVADGDVHPNEEAMKILDSFGEANR